MFANKTTNIYPVTQPHKHLFEDATFSNKPFQHSQHIGYALFNNSTRCQLKNLTK